MSREITPQGWRPKLDDWISFDGPQNKFLNVSRLEGTVVRPYDKASDLITVKTEYGKYYEVNLAHDNVQLKPMYGDL